MTILALHRSSILLLLGLIIISALNLIPDRWSFPEFKTFEGSHRHPHVLFSQRLQRFSFWLSPEILNLIQLAISVSELRNGGRIQIGFFLYKDRGYFWLSRDSYNPIGLSLFWLLDTWEFELAFATFKINMLLWLSSRNHNLIHRR